MQRDYQHSKWTSVDKVKGWRHFEVINVNKKTKEKPHQNIAQKS